MTVIENLSPFLFCYIFHVGPTSGFLLLHDFEEFRPVSIWLPDPHRHFGVSQPSGRVAACGAGEDDSCHLLSRKYTRDPPHSKHPNAHLPFLSTASHHPLVQFSPEERNLTTGSNYFSSRSLCFRVSVGSLPTRPCDRAQSSDTDFGMFMRHASRIFPYFGRSEERGNYALWILPHRVKPAVRRGNQHLSSQHRET